MPGLDDLVEGVFGGVGWGVGLAAVAVAALVGGSRAKPLAKQAVKGYLAASQRVREWSAEATEQLQDIYAEAKYEYESGVTEEAPAEPEAAPRRRGARATGEQPA